MWHAVCYETRMDVVSTPDHFWTVLWRLVLATFCGAAIGFNREMWNKPAGLRTHALVALGSALITLVSLLLTVPGAEDLAAPGRVLQGLLAGIGFIGGGVILHRERTGEVEGLTTAASVLVVAAAGAAVGAGLWKTALASVVLAILVLSLGPLDRKVQKIGEGKSR
jgi:putative Mg2+ transporter-C (MgtC) family protein